MDKLKPCPFCGGTWLDHVVIEDSTDRSKVECCTCEAVVYGDTLIQVVTKWNKRI